VAVIRKDVTVEENRARLFNTDMCDMRTIMRADVLVPNPLVVCRMTGVLP